MNKKTKKILMFILSFMITVIIGIQSTQVNADFMSDANIWWSKNDPTNIQPIRGIDEIVELVNVAGTAVIAIVTVILGIKYMISSAVGKSEVKGQLASLLVACILFFGWSNLSNILIKGAQFNTTTGGYDNIDSNTQLFIFEKTSDAKVIFSRIFAIVIFLARIIAVIVTMVIGAKYIFGGSNAKSEIKQRGPMYVIGILMIFCTLEVLSFISDAIIEALNV